MLGFSYLDTGAMYRMAALLASRRLAGSPDPEAVARIAGSSSISAGPEGAFLDGEDVTTLIRTSELGEAASLLSAAPSVRRAMVAKQREAAAGRDVVAEGRDMGTVVFPDAVLKVYVTADIAVRGIRRTRDLAGHSGARLSEVFADVVESLMKRDARDRERPDSPLRRASDAFLLDTSAMSVGEQVEKVVSLFRAARGGGEC